MFTVCHESCLSCTLLFYHHTNIKVDILLITVREIWKLRHGEVQ